MTERHAPELVCDECHRTIARDVLTARVTSANRVTSEFMGVTFDNIRDPRPGQLCEPCWDGLEPDDDLRWRRGEVNLYRIGGARPHVIRQACEHCGRPVLCDVSRRRLVSCSKRCQVYASQDRWPKERRPRPERTCPRCGATFPAAREDHHFCSHACRQADYRNRRKR